MVKSNYSYFEFSLNNNDEILNTKNKVGQLVISKSISDKETNLSTANKNLISKINAYEQVKLINNSTEVLNNIVDNIIEIIENTKLINYSAFCCYWPVIDFSYSSYMSTVKYQDQETKRNLMKILLDLYIENRHNMYLLHGYSDQVLQVNSDIASSRRKGKTGILKIENIIQPLGFHHIKKFADSFNYDKWYLLPDKGDRVLFKLLLSYYHVDFLFQKTRDNKLPDVMFYFKNNFYIMEHKLTNGGGGSQNAELNEIIQFISFSEKNKNVHYLSCLQGDYFRKLKLDDDSENKYSVQRDNILTNLKNNTSNYFVNGKGFEMLINDIVV